MHAKFFFVEKVCSLTKFDLRLKKKTKRFGAISNFFGKNFVSPSKIGSHTISIYWNCMISIFSKNENLGFLSPECCIRIKQPQN